MFELPTRSDLVYRGKYPNRICSVGYSNSQSQQVIGHFLGIRKPVHLELNCGRRFIIAGSSLNWHEPQMGLDISRVTVNPVEPVERLTQDRYDAMMAEISKIKRIA